MQQFGDHDGKSKTSSGVDAEHCPDGDPQQNPEHANNPSHARKLARWRIGYGNIAAVRLILKPRIGPKPSSNFACCEIYHMKGSPVDPNRLYASQSGGWFGYTMLQPVIWSRRRRRIT